jgi:hypothetical protein
MLLRFPPKSIDVSLVSVVVEIFPITLIDLRPIMLF